MLREIKKNEEKLARLMGDQLTVQQKLEKRKAIEQMER